jgi:hypothetical protein
MINTTTRIEQNIADPCPLHYVQLHPVSGLLDAARDFLHCLATFRIAVRLDNGELSRYPL